MEKIIIVIIFAFFIICSCSNQSSKNPNNMSPKNLSSNNAIIHNQNEKAAQIANFLMQNGEFNKVVVVVNGNVALIGLDVKNKTLDKNYYKKMAINQVRIVDESVTQVEVTTDEKMYKRIRKLSEDINSGVPLKGIIDEFLKMLK